MGVFLGGKPQNNAVGKPAFNAPALQAKQPVVASIPNVGQINAEAERETARLESKSFNNDLTEETKQAIRQRVSDNLEAAFAGKELSTMVLSHLCFVSPTSIKSRGKNTNSANEVVIAQYSGDKRTTARETKIGTSLACYVAGLDAAGQAEFLKIAVNPVALSQLMKNLNLKD